jgi:TolA-binding protein
VRLPEETTAANRACGAERLVCLLPVCLAPICLLPVFLLLVMPQGAARADGAALPPTARQAKGVKRTTVEVKEIERRITRPDAPAPAAKERQPGIGVDDFTNTKNRVITQVTKHQIAKMRALIDATSEDDPQKPDFFFRAGELYVEMKRFFFARARALDQPIFELPPERRGPLQTEQRSYERQEQQWVLEAVKAYVGATKYPKYERMDEVLFRLAALLASVKKDDQAREYFHRLIKDHPNSKYIPDAYLAFAEHAFDRGEMDAALKFYEKVEQFPKSSVYPYAAYKKGWCYANLGDHKTALEAFVDVVRLTQSGKAAVDPRLLQVLAKEAKKDIVKAYAHVAGADKARPFFAKVGGDYAPKMLELLAELYWEQGKPPESTRVYKQIIAANMSSPRVCEWQSKILRNALSLTSYDKALVTQELERLGTVYTKAPPTNREQAAECRASFHDAARELALVWHREAQRTQDPPTFELADRAYRLFLTNFRDDKQAYEMGFYRGELLWVLHRWKDAAEQYTEVVEAQPAGKYRREAAFAAVLAWKNALQVEDEGRRQELERSRERLGVGEGCGRLTPQTISDNEQKMIAAFHTYRKQVPDAADLPVMLYREAYIYYDHNRFDRAEPLFLEVVQKYPKHELAVYSANLFLDALNAECKSRDVLSWTRTFIAMPELARDAEFTAQMVSLISDGYDREGRDHEQRGDAKECGRSFLAAADALPTHAKHAERLWNAGQCFQNAHLVGQAIKTWEALMKAHPEHALAKRALYRIGAGKQQLAFYEAAADNYETFAKRYPGEPEARTALGNATVFREGLQQPREALADMDAFVAFYGGRDPQDAAGVFFQKGEVYEAQGRVDDLRGHLRAYLDRWAKHGGLDREVQAHFRLGELAWKGSCARATGDGACMHVDRLTASRGRQVIDAANRRFKTRTRTQCGPATKSKIVLYDRSRGPASAAEEHFRAAIALWKGGDAGNPIMGRDAEARRAGGAYAAAGAAFYLAEKDYEDLLRLKFPQNLDFSKPSAKDSPGRRAAVAKKLADSNKRFAAYLEEKTRLIEKTRQRYLDVFKLRQAQWTIAAAARVGQLHQDFAGQLYTADIPKDLPDSDAWGNHPRDLYCEALEDKAEKVEVKAVESFRACLTAATQQSWFNNWSRLCERELNQLKPAEFPVSSEAKPEVGYVPLTIAPAPLARLANVANVD